ncbi:hypothetical protein DWB77_05520 [Streptomyces hundungensis]|uniref:Uncharacterized protein n=1 Tax=Streptomyces hundungensis TaxID=1077946 RepID=A0A387HIK4_9ACTN|nr:hypothetical protein DWB77_05520 [Streptomyces hundungensis]
MAQTRKGYYRAAHYVKPTTVSSRAKKPGFWAAALGVLLLIAAWNTFFGESGDGTKPQPQRTVQSVTGTPSH